MSSGRGDSVRRLVEAIACAVGWVSAAASAQAPAGSSAPLDCGRGPVQKSYGGVPWLAYGCSDGRSVVLMSAPGSPAMPFYFTFAAKDAAYRLVGEGTGSKVVTDKAFKELRALSDSQIRRIYQEAAAATPRK